jgi:photosystem II stability/assembly factor-like uncharacterized protein
VEFVDANNGWAVGGTGTILHTSNGGTIWEGQASPTVENLYAVEVLVPEPGTVTLLVIGLAGMVIAGWRKRKSSETQNVSKIRAARAAVDVT